MNKAASIIAKAAAWTTLLLVSSCTAVFMGPCAHDTFMNDRHRSQIAEALENLPAPPGTQRLAFRSGVGNLIGGGNKLVLFAGALYKTPAGSNAVIQHYEGKIFYNPHTEINESFAVMVLTNAGALGNEMLPLELNRPEGWGVDPAEFSRAEHSTNTIFLVRILRFYRKNADPRCW